MSPSRLTQAKADAKPGRRAAERAGRRAEAVASLSLRLKGYRILARNWRSPAGEIDLIARRGRLLVFVEVKYRMRPAAAPPQATPRQWARIACAAATFVAARPALHGHRWRFDLVQCAPRRWPKQVEDVWRAR